jgi:hypothetical protein
MEYDRRPAAGLGGEQRLGVAADARDRVIAVHQREVDLPALALEL